MPKKKKQDSFAGLTWNDINEWAGERIASRGRSYQRNGNVSDLAVSGDGDLIAWVDGTNRYATKVRMNGKAGLPYSICSCPYGNDCKHGVAVVLEYLKYVEEDRDVPEASENDERLDFIEDEDDDDELMDDEDDESLSDDQRKEISSFLKNKTKTQLIELFLEIAERHPDTGRELVDHKQLASGDTSGIVTRLRREIRELSAEYDCQDRWGKDYHSPDITGIRNKLASLLAAGHADEVLSLGKALIAEGTHLVQVYDDEGEAGMEVSACHSVIVSALEQSSLEPVDKLEWVVNVILEDEYGLCDAFSDYLDQKHGQKEWSLLSDRLLTRLNALEFPANREDHHRRHQREHLCSIAIRALERAGRTDKVIPLCKTEAELTGSYERLVGRLMDNRQYEEAEHWIVKGIGDIGQQRLGIANSLRESLRKIRAHQKNWPSIAAMQVDDFVRYASETSYADCKKSAVKAGVWPQVREHLRAYLESGVLPWKQEKWPLPETVLSRPGSSQGESFPRIRVLIDVAIFEKEPESVLYWYDRLQETRYGFDGENDDRIAQAVTDYSPERAVAIWRKMAERQIALVKPKAYWVAARYLRKAERVMILQKKSADWKGYLLELRRIHARKRRFIEILNSLDSKPIVKGNR